MKTAPSNLVSVECPLCRGREQRIARRLNGHRIVSCGSCGFQFANPRHSEEAILRAYTADSKGEDLSFSQAYESAGPLEAGYSWTGEYVLKRFVANKPKGSFLDVGAGQGWAVWKALALGCDAYGFEFGDERAFERHENLKSRIFRTEQALEGSAKKFDLILISAVLEHVYRPIDFLKHWMRLLNPGGLVCAAAVPNMDSIFIRLGWDGWDGNIPPHHLNFFTPETLRSAVVRADGRMMDFYTMGAPVSAHVFNPLKQKYFEGPVWGDDARGWKFALDRKNKTFVEPSQTQKTLTGALNHCLKATGRAANLYATFGKGGQ